MLKFIYSLNDKFLHFITCFLVGIFSTEAAVGLSVGKEFGDMKTDGNHWCWYDLLADTAGVVLGTAVRILVLYAIYGEFKYNWY